MRRVLDVLGGVPLRLRHADVQLGSRDERRGVRAASIVEVAAGAFEVAEGRLEPRVIGTFPFANASAKTPRQ